MSTFDRFDTEAAWLVSELERLGFVRVDVVPNPDGTVSCFHAAIMDGERSDVELRFVDAAGTRHMYARCLGETTLRQHGAHLRVWIAERLRQQKRFLPKQRGAQGG